MWAGQKDTLKEQEIEIGKQLSFLQSKTDTVTLYSLTNVDPLLGSPVMFSGVTWTLKSEPLLGGQHLPMYCGPNEPLRNMPLTPKMQLAHSIISP